MTPAELVKTNLLNRAYVDKKIEGMRYVAKDSPYRAAQETEIAELEARWTAEAPAREARQELEKAGFRKSKYGEEWIRLNKVTQRWDKFTVEEACDKAGLK
jgi:hypothetical protein